MNERASETNVATPILSVILPNYNHAAYLAHALDALLSQELPADEIIVVDDCSTDDSRDVVKRYAEKHSSVRLLANPRNLGAIATLSRGLNEARGQYLYFGAADDFVMPGFFAIAIRMLRAHPSAGLFCGDAILIDGRSRQTMGIRPPVRPRFSAGFINPAKVAKLLRRNDNFIVTGAAVFRRDAVTWAGDFDERLSSFADSYLARIVALTFGFCYAPNTVVTWCVFPGGVSRTTSTERALRWQVLGNITTLMAASPVFPRWYQDVFVRRWRFWISRLGVQANPVDRDVLMDMGAQNGIDRTLYGLVLKIFSGDWARFLILSWLWLRLRPYSLSGLGATVLMRQLDNFHTHSSNIMLELGPKR